MTGICSGQTAEDYYDKGIEYSAVGEFETAQQEFKKALEADPFYEPAKICLELVQDAPKSRTKTESALHLFKGVAYHNKQMYDEAITWFRKAIEVDPEYAEAHYNLASAYYDKWMYDEAIAEFVKSFEKALRIDPSYGVFLFMPARMCLKPSPSQDALRRTIKVEAVPHLLQALVYYDEQKYDEAIAEFKKAVELNPNLAEAHYNLGVVYLTKELFDEAIAEFKRAIDIAPEFAPAHNNLAIIYYSKGEYSLAIEHCDRAIELGHKVQPEFLELLRPYRGN